VSISDDSCGPAGCQFDWLMAERVEVDADPAAFSEFAFRQGWTDGHPVLVPTTDVVRRYVEASGWRPEKPLGTLPPDNRECTVEYAAISAAMAGLPYEAMPLVCDIIMLRADSPMYGPVTTTNCAAPVYVVNGTTRDTLQIPYGPGCFGGATTRASTIGRTIQLISRNVGGELIGETSKSTFGHPARLAAIVVGEWEEQSPWAPLGVREGAGSDAVTSFVTTGTADVVDVYAASGRDLATIIGHSLTAPAQATIISPWGGDMLLALCPPWATLIAADFPAIEDVQHYLWEHAVVPRDRFPASHQEHLDKRGLFDAQGRVRVVGEPKDIHLFTAGGQGSLHALAMIGFGRYGRVQSRPLTLGRVPVSA
jgi:hypothetical protein